MKKLTAIILAAGSGLRLRPYSEFKPKCLISVDHIPIIFRQIVALKKVHVKRFIIVVGFQDKLIQEYLNKNFPELNIIYVRNNIYKSTNTLYSLALTIPYVSSFNSVFLLNGDVLLEEKTLKLCSNLPTDMSYAIIRQGETDTEDIKVLVDSHMRINKINKKIIPKKACGEAIGIYKLSHLFWQRLCVNLKILKNRHSEEFYEFAFEKTISQTLPLYAKVLQDELAFEIDTLKDLTKAEILVKCASHDLKKNKKIIRNLELNQIIASIKCL